MHLRELWRQPLGLAVSVIVALVAAVWSVADIGILPPRLEPRAVEMATAYTEVVVDTRYSSVTDLRQATDDIQPLRNRAVLIGTMMGTAPVRAHIARRAGVPVDRLQIVAPRTPQQPRPVLENGAKKGPGDLFKSTDQYRLDIQVNPTVPFLDIYAQAPTAEASEQLANAAVDGLDDYLRKWASSDRTPEAMQVRLKQQGSARGEVINEGVQLQVVFVVFCVVFGLSSAVLIMIERVRRGWQYEAVAVPRQ
jgi:hypothetical protein